MVTIPRLVVAAPASGHGKTSVTTGLLVALRQRGFRVSPHKVGPDYIDPSYHALAAGRVGRNLDPWLVGDDLIAPLFAHGADGAEIAVVEGVMGLFDGVADRPGYASTAHVASLLQAPVVLVVDATAVGRSVAALIHGFATFDPSVRLGGVIFNRVGSTRHATILADALAEVGLPLLGSIGRHDGLVTPSRHLGLVPAAERHQAALCTVAELGRVIGESVDLAAVVRLARSAAPIVAEPWTAPIASRAGPRPVVAVAGGPAFTFSYAETAELLTAAGADVVTVDPLVDPELPCDAAGLVLGGGFPEMHAEALVANEPLRRAVGGFRGPISAECAGLLYLARTLDDKPMCGLVDTDASMTPTLTIGYREAVAATSSILDPAGARVRGHEFHRTACSPATRASPAWVWRGSDGDSVTEGFVTATLHASYLHTHWAGRPGAAERFVNACVESRVAPSR